MDVSWIIKYTHKWRSFLNIDVPWPPDYTYTKHFSYYMSVMRPIITPIRCILRKIWVKPRKKLLSHDRAKNKKHRINRC